MSIFLLPYKPASASAKLIASSLNISRLRHTHGVRTFRRPTTIINWGASSIPARLVINENVTWLNAPEHVTRASNKLSSFERLVWGDVPCPQHTTSEDEARTWLEGGNIVLARTLLNASSGRGIVVMHELSDLVRAPLYTKYVKKQAEYRVHILNGQVIDVVQKKRGTNWAGNNTIRTHSEGWIFARDGIQVPQAVKDVSLKTIEVFSLDFGAVDVLWNQYHGCAYVCEVNTAPGLESGGTTLQRYTESFREHLQL